jgi:type VI protein secretion system component Hcp
MKPHFALLIAVLWLGCQAPILAQGVYLQIAGITDGAGTNPALRDQVKLSTFAYGQKTPVTIGGSGASAGRPTFMSIEIAKPVDASSSKLQQALTSATAFRSPPLINFYDANLRLVYQIKLGTAFISDYSANGDDICTGGCPGLLENITLQYGQVKVTDSSRAGTPLTFSWNVIANNASTGL